MEYKDRKPEGLPALQDATRQVINMVNKKCRFCMAMKRQFKKYGAAGATMKTVCADCGYGLTLEIKEDGSVGGMLLSELMDEARV